LSTKYSLSLLVLLVVNPNSYFPSCQRVRGVFFFPYISQYVGVIFNHNNIAIYCYILLYYSLHCHILLQTVSFCYILLHNAIHCHILLHSGRYILLQCCTLLYTTTYRRICDILLHTPAVYIAALCYLMLHTSGACRKISKGFSFSSIWWSFVFEVRCL